MSRTILWTELMKHTTKHDCWLLINDNVYDVTSYLAEHPGGDDILLKNAGRDATQQFRDVNNHTDYAISLREQRKIGVIENNPPPAEYNEWLKKQVTQYKVMSWEEVKIHNSPTDCWVVIDNKVFNLTNYLNKHPGGPKVLAGKAGKDGSLAFKAANHPTYVLQERETYQVGVVEGSDPNPNEKPKSEKSYLVNIVIVVVILALAFCYPFILDQFAPKQ